MFKWCEFCQKDHPLTEEFYHKNKQNKNGLHTYCKKERAFYKATADARKAEKNKIRHDKYEREKNKMRWTAILKRIKDIPNPVGAEIGVFQGELSKKLLEGHMGLKLHMIDSWNFDTYFGKDEQAVSERFRKKYTEDCIKNYNIALRNVSEFEDRTAVFMMKSVEAVKNYEDGYFDFVFIDAAHDYDSVIEDIAIWMPKVKKGGLICGHDYGVENFPGVKRAVDSVFDVDELELDVDYTWFVRV